MRAAEKRLHERSDRTVAQRDFGPKQIGVEIPVAETRIAVVSTEIAHYPDPRKEVVCHRRAAAIEISTRTICTEVRERIAAENFSPRKILRRCSAGKQKCSRAQQDPLFHLVLP